jgi:hypothetical protein
MTTPNLESSPRESTARSSSSDNTIMRFTPDPGATAVPGPLPGTRITEPYARMVARNVYFWAWPMVNIYNRRLAFSQCPKPGLMNGLPFAPLGLLSMLHDYIEPAERWVACPNQDVVYGAGIAALDQSPVVVQIPNFGKRFWVYQIVDLRTDSFADLGAMYGTKPGFYLLAGPTWHGEVPDGITHVFTAKTGTAMVVPRVFQDDSPEDRAAVQSVIAGIDMYPLAAFDGKMKQHDWRQNPQLGSASDAGAGAAETRWVFPEKFFDQLPQVLADAPPLPGEEARYAEVLAVLAAAQKDPALKKALIEEATSAEQDVVGPLLQFRNFGVPLPHNWTTQNNGAQFGTDYFMRTAIARSNILVNKPVETKYFYQDLDASGARLNGSKRYAVTFGKDEPPVKGFWSLTLYDRYHFFVPNSIQRYSLGTKNKDLKSNADGTLTIFVQADAPTDPVQRANWLPAPHGDDFSLFIRAYWPEAAVVEGRWTPPGVQLRREL